jgi:hypothetical protein
MSWIANPPRRREEPRPEIVPLCASSIARVRTQVGQTGEVADPPQQKVAHQQPDHGVSTTVRLAALLNDRSFLGDLRAAPFLRI